MKVETRTTLLQVLAPIVVAALLVLWWMLLPREPERPRRPAVRVTMPATATKPGRE